VAVVQVPTSLLAQVDSAYGGKTGVDLPEGPYATIGGYLMAVLGRLPQSGDEVEFRGYLLAITEVDGRRVARVLITPPQPDHGDGAPAADARIGNRGSES